MRFTFDRGVPSAAAQLAGGGLGVTAEAYSVQWWVGWCLFCFGVALLLWGARWDGQSWWQALPSLKNPFRRRGPLHPCRIYINDQVATANYIEVTIFIFNGTGKKVRVLSVAGHMSVTVPVSVGSVDISFDAPPTLIPPVADNVEAGTEFTITLRQAFSSSQITPYQRNMLPGTTASVTLEDIEIIAETVKGHNRMVVPLWDGFTYKDGAVRGRITAVVGRASLRGKASVN